MPAAGGALTRVVPVIRIRGGGTRTTGGSVKALTLSFLVLTSIIGTSCARGIQSASDRFGNGDTGRVVDAATIEKSGARTVWDAMARTIPFYTFNYDGRIEHRGRTSLFLPDQPIVVLDGVTLTDVTVLTEMPASDVWLIQVLDGVDATTLYGTNAGQGAIRIFTKDGRADAGR